MTSARHESRQPKRTTRNLNAELRRARLGIEVAVAVVPLIRMVVPDHGDRVLVIGDIVDRWLALSAAQRSEYHLTGWSGASAVAQFAGDYCDALERPVLDRAGCDRSDISPDEEERIIQRCWLAHVRAMRRSARPSVN